VRSCRARRVHYITSFEYETEIEAAGALVARESGVLIKGKGIISRVKSWSRNSHQRAVTAVAFAA